MVAPSFSESSTSTAMEIEEWKMPPVQAVLSIDDQAIPGSGLRYNTEKFAYEHFNFSIHYQNIESHVGQANVTQLVLSVAAQVAGEYNLLYQLRVRVGKESPQQTEVVDRLMVEFHPHGRPLAIAITDERIRFVKLEMRTVNKHFLPHPLFNEGDVDILFADGSKLRTWRALLALTSPYMAETLSNPQHDTVYFHAFPRDSVKELLLHLYLPRRSANWEFLSLAKAAVGYDFKPIIYKLSRSLMDSCGRKLSMEEKWQLALNAGLEDAFQELVRDAVIDGYWAEKLREGWDPVQSFTYDGYEKWVRPVLAAVCPNDTTSLHFLSDPWIHPHYFMPGPHKVKLFFVGTPFYVNKGILQLQGLQAFQKASDGSLAAIFTKEMEVICGKTKTLPGKVLIALLNSLHPGGPPVEAQCLRGAIAFASTHQWHVAKEELEQRLLLEPPHTAQHFLQQLLFAERFNLHNMLRTCFFRAEGAFNSFATELAKEGFVGISQATKKILVDRLCSGWAIYPRIVNRLTVRQGTEQLEREANLEKGGPADTDHDVLTMAEVLSDYIYGPLGDFYKEEKEVREGLTST